MDHLDHDFAHVILSDLLWSQSTDLELWDILKNWMMETDKYIRPSEILARIRKDISNMNLFHIGAECMNESGDDRLKEIVGQVIAQAAQLAPDAALEGLQ